MRSKALAGICFRAASASTAFPCGFNSGHRDIKRGLFTTSRAPLQRNSENSPKPKNTYFTNTVLTNSIKIQRQRSCQDSLHFDPALLTAHSCPADGDPTGFYLRLGVISIDVSFSHRNDATDSFVSTFLLFETIQKLQVLLM